MSGLGERLRTARGVESREKAADRLGVHPNTLAKYEKDGRSPDAEFLVRFCEVYGVSEAWLLTGREPMKRSLSEAAGRALLGDISRLGRRDGPPSDAPGIVAVPLYDVRAGAGAAQLANHEDASERVLMSEPLLVSLGVKPQAAGIMITDGPSMEDTIRHGEPIGFDTSEREPRDAIFIIRREGGVQVKRLQRRTDGALMLISDNPTFAPELLPRDEAEDIELIARVKFVLRRL